MTFITAGSDLIYQSANTLSRSADTIVGIEQASGLRRYPIRHGIFTFDKQKEVPMKSSEQTRTWDPYEIDVDDPREIAYMEQQFPWLSADSIRKTIREHGPDRKAVLTYLDAKSRKRTQSNG